MRQAGRYMQEYRSLRDKYSFLDLCKNPELIVSVTKLPIEKFHFDAAIVFSDILLILEALGMNVRFEEGIGPIVEGKDLKEIEKSSEDKIKSSLNFVYTGIKELKKELKVPLIGFVGAPFTVLSYVVEGRSSKDLKKTKMLMQEDPHLFEKLLEIITEATIFHVQGQIQAGCDALQIFDSWANFLDMQQFEKYSVQVVDKILKKIDHFPTIFFCKGSSSFYERVAEIQPSALSIDWMSNIREMRKKLGGNIVLQGNLDPDILCEDIEVVKKEVKSLLQSMQGDPAFIFNLGHGIKPHTPEKNVQLLVDLIHGR